MKSLFHSFILILLALSAVACGGGKCEQKGSAPVIAVGIMTVPEVALEVRDSAGAVVDSARIGYAQVDSVMTIAAPTGGTIELRDVTIGVGFHWQQKENQRFKGDIRLVRQGDNIIVINDIDVESYLESVISSEMNGNAPDEFLRAHAIISRSWLLAQIGRKGHKASTRRESPGEVVAWYDRDDHDLFDVCADDHCQRYQGIARIDNPRVAEAVRATAGRVLTFGGELCDARFSKCCGGVTEEFENCWEDEHKPYLEARCDAPAELPVPDLTDEAAAREWIHGSPDAFCSQAGSATLAVVLNGYDRPTADFFRWRVVIGADSLGRLFALRTGRDIGYIRELRPLSRGRSGRITRLLVKGDRDSIIIGKELEIRRSLSTSHLYSSAFDARIDGDGSEAVVTLDGAGWGHGVGLCQIGAAVMSTRGYGHAAILEHYFPGSTIEKIY